MGSLLTLPIIVISLSSIFTAAISAVAGMAGGLILLSVLTFFLPLREAIPLHGFAQTCSNIGRVVTHWSDVQRRIALSFSLAVIPGTFLGMKVMNAMNPLLLQLGIGLMILWTLYSPTMTVRQKPLPLVVFIMIGFISSFFGVLVGATGPLIAPFFFGLPKNQLIATKAACQSFVHLMKIPAFLTLGGLSFQSQWPMLTVILFTTLLGVSIGNKIVDGISERTYTRIIRVVLLILALKMIIQSSIELWR